MAAEEEKKLERGLRDKGADAITSTSLFPLTAALEKREFQFAFVRWSERERKGQEIVCVECKDKKGEEKREVFLLRRLGEGRKKCVIFCKRWVFFFSSF